MTLEGRLRLLKVLPELYKDRSPLYQLIIDAVKRNASNEELYHLYCSASSADLAHIQRFIDSVIIE